MFKGISLAVLTVLLFSGVNAISEIDYIEWNATTGIQPNMIQIASNVYAITYQGAGTDGWIATVTMDASGNIGASVIDTLDFETGAVAYPQLKHISGNTYAVAYTGNDSDGWVASFTIDSSGNIGDSVIDYLEWDASNGQYPDFIQVSGNTYAVAYTGVGSDGWVASFTIDASGNIGDSVIDSFEFDAADCLNPDITNLSSGYFAVSYTGSASDGWLKSFTIDASGNIGDSVIDQYEWDIDNGIQSNIYHVNGNYYMIAYQGVDTDGYVKTVSISGTGSITPSVIDSLEFDPIECYWPDIARVSGDYFVIAYRGPDVDGWLSTVTIDSSGNIGNSVFSTYEYELVNNYYTSILPVNGYIFAVAYEGDGNDGWLKSFNLNPEFCGDSSCNTGESYSNCPADCCESDCTATSDSVLHYACNGYNSCSILSGCDGRAAGYLYCVDSNTYGSCPYTQTDCTGGLYCNNGACSSCSSVCDNTCNGGIPCYGTDPDCDASGIASLTCCGNTKCEGSAGESCTTCPNDCGACQINYGVCGNGLCELNYNSTYSETCSSCSLDCGACGASVCDATACRGVCDTCKEYQCKSNACVCDYVSNCCGNNVCEMNESYGNCAKDCLPSSINVNILSPASGSIFMRGEKINVTANVTFNEGFSGWGSNTTLKTSWLDYVLNDSNLDGVFDGLVTVSSLAPAGLLNLEVNAKRGVSGSGFKTITISNEYIISCYSNKESYFKNERVILSGSVANARGEFIDNALITVLINNETVTTRSVDGFYNVTYQTNILDTTGTWVINALVSDAFNNTGYKSLSFNVSEPETGTYYTINIESPDAGIVRRGRDLTITAKVLLGETLIDNASVKVRLPSREFLDLEQVSEGTYSNEYTVGFDDALGDWVMEIVAIKDSLTGTDSLVLDIRPSDISVSIISPTKSSYSTGDDLYIEIEARYPNGDPVELSELNVTVGNNTLTLQSKGDGLYASTYSISEVDSEVPINILVTDESNNTISKSIIVNVSGVSPLYYFKAYPFIVYPLIIGGVAGLIMLSLRFISKGSIESLNRKKNEIIELKKKNQEAYYEHQSINKDVFSERERGYNNQIEQFESKIKKINKKKD